MLVSKLPDTDTRETRRRKLVTISIQTLVVRASSFSFWRQDAVFGDKIASFSSLFMIQHFRGKCYKEHMHTNSAEQVRVNGLVITTVTFSVTVVITLCWFAQQARLLS